ncbi:MAG: hypothetical protein AAGA77_23795, partial [Bacteroidota bacterium]
ASSGIATNGEDAKLNLNNGTAVVGVPLLTLSDVGNSLPISLSYQTGGIMVSQPATEIGLGWNLNAGGSISREVKGLPDDFNENDSYGFLFINDECEVIDEDKYLDRETDIYTYNILGYTGKFFFDNDRNIIQVNQSDVRIEKVDYESFDCNSIIFWKITLPNGTIAHFGGIFTNGDTYLDNVIMDEDEDDELEYTSTWFLREIEFLNGRKFTFQYIPNLYYDYVIEHNQALVRWPSQVLEPPKSVHNLIERITYQSKIISEISSDNYKVVFNHEERTDLKPYILEPAGIEVAPPKISSMEYTTIDGTCIQEIQFVQSYFNSSNDGLPYTPGYELDDGTALDGMHDTRRLKLDHVKIKDCGSEESYDYDIDYFEEVALPRRLSYAQDLWGYYNGVEDNKSLVPKVQFASDCFSPVDFFDFENYWLANRDVDMAHAKAGAIRKLTYPNGYFNEFEYESNTINQINHDFVLIEEEETSNFEAILTNVNLDGDENKFQIFIENTPTDPFYYDFDLLVKQSSDTEYTLIEEFDDNNPYEDFSLVYYSQNLKDLLGFVEGVDYDIKLVINNPFFPQVINLSYFQSTLKAENVDVGGLRVSKLKTPFVDKNYDYNRVPEKQEYYFGGQNTAKNFNICKSCDSNFQGKNESSTRAPGEDFCPGNQKDYLSNFYLPCNVEKVILDLNVISGPCDGDVGVMFTWSGVQSGSETLFNTNTSPVSKTDTLYDPANNIFRIQPNDFYNFVFEAFPNRPVHASARLLIYFEDEEPIYITPETDQSNGHLINVPSYLSLYNSLDSDSDSYIDEECVEGNVFQIYSSPTTRIHSLNGGHILYDRITETINNGGYGYTQHDFFEDKDFLTKIGLKNKLNSIFPLFAHVPTVESIYLNPLVGLPESSRVFNADGVEVLVTTSEYEVEESKYTFNRQAQINLCSEFNNNEPFIKEVSTNYSHTSFLVSLIKTESTQDGITLVTDYEYRPDRLHKMPIRIKTNVKENPDHQATFKSLEYAHDVIDYGHSEILKELNVVNVPLIELTDYGYKGGTKTEYSVVTDQNNPDKLIVRPKSKFAGYREDGQLVWKKVEEVVSYTDQIHPHEVWSKFEPLNTFNLWEDDLLKSQKYGIRETTYKYDGIRRMYKSTNPLGLSTEIVEYDGFHRVIIENKEINAGNFIIKDYVYEINKTGDDVITHTTTFPTGDYDLPPRVIIKTFDERGLLLLEREENYLQDGELRFDYNNYNHLGSHTLNFTNEGVVNNTYSNDVRQRLETIKPKGTDALVTYAYGTNSGGEVSGFAAGTLSKASVTDENGVTTHIFKNFKGNKVLSIDGMGFETRYEYFYNDLLKEVVPPGSSLGNTDLNYSYVYTPDFKLEEKTIPGRNTEKTIYDPEFEYVSEVILHNGEKLTYEFNDDYLDFMEKVKLNGEEIKSFIPYHADLLTNWVKEEKTRVLGTSNFLKMAYDYDDIGRVDFSRIEHIDGGMDEVANIFDHMNNIRESTVIHSGNDDFTTTHYYDYDKGLRVERSRASLPINGEQKEIIIHENIYDGRDWLTEVKVNDGLHTNSYTYHNRGLLKKINSVESTSDPSDEDCEENEPPPIIPGCEGPYQVDDISLFYDCFQLSTGAPTTVSVTINSSIDYGDGSSQIIDSNTYAFGFNGGGESESLDNPITAENSINNNSSGSIAAWIFSIIQNCIHAAEDSQISLQNSVALENMMLQLGGEDPIDPDNPEEPDDPFDPTDPNPGSSLFGLEIYYEEGNSELGAQGYSDGTISWIEWKAKGEMYQAYGYQYDDKYRLTAATYKVDDPGGCFGIPQGAYNTTYAYDARGNFTTITRQGVTGIDSEGAYEYGAIDNLTFAPTVGNQISSITESEDSKKGYQTVGGSYGYANGNLISSPQVSNVTYNHMDLPTFIESGEGSITITYDADGNKLKQIEVNAEGESMTTTYMGQMHYVNNERSSLYHEGGRVMYNVDLPDEANHGPKDYTEWSIMDHLGNTRVRYIDKNEDGSITNNRFDEKENEISGTYHYYPYGLVMEGNFYTHQGIDENYQYNGIEHTSVLGSSIGLTTFRVHDAAIGGWWQVDPQAAAAYSHSPHNSMFNNPISNVDPEGDLAFLPVLIGAGIGVLTNGISNTINNQGFFDGWGKSALVGGIGGVLGQFGGGSLINDIAWGSVEGGITGGIGAELNGGSFLDGFKSGALIGGGATFAFNLPSAIKNYKDGFGFRTNIDAFENAANEAVVDGVVDNTKAKRALDFWTDRFGGPKLYRDKMFNKFPPFTDAYSGRIYITDAPFLMGGESVTANIVHETAHYYKTMIWKDGVVGGKGTGGSHVEGLDIIPDYDHGTIGYYDAIRQSGRYNISYKALNGSPRN